MEGLLIYGMVAIFVAAVCSGVAAWVASEKNRPGIEGAVIGFLFGPLGLLKHGNDVVYKPGTDVKVFTDSTVVVHVPIVASSGR